MNIGISISELKTMSYIEIGELKSEWTDRIK